MNRLVAKLKFLYIFHCAMNYEAEIVLSLILNFHAFLACQMSLQKREYLFSTSSCFKKAEVAVFVPISHAYRRTVLTTIRLFFASIIFAVKFSKWFPEESVCASCIKTTRISPFCQNIWIKNSFYHFRFIS